MGMAALCLAVDFPCRKASRAPQAKGGARPACLSTWMCEFGPAPFDEERRVPERLHRSGDAGTSGFGYFCRNKSDPRAQRVEAFDPRLKGMKPDTGLTGF